MVITKEEVHNAFKLHKRKRNRLLYEHYYELFQKDLTADYLSQKITEDLDFPISSSIIYKIRHRIQKKEKISPVTTGSSSHTESIDNDHAFPEGKKSQQQIHTDTYHFKNTDDYPDQDALDKAFEDL